MKRPTEKCLINPSRDDLLQKVDNKYLLSVLVTKRARQLFDNDEPLIDENYINKVSMAINEIDQGKVSISRTDGGVKSE
ncbi:MAG: DNA-directed RNA polymerase subunit omega [Eubacteriaceae bacterium]|nr:DNA-directed RNA polymerase subunit omega [Eubacteriaceae bacterium]MBR5995788.1 DNA-directed RNA polymerase subunit omega [Eubacteriaceae bacterium]MCR4723692.1 DNA-directed RNA polymerase subunit omega [Eubacteriales bacterium]